MRQTALFIEPIELKENIVILAPRRKKKLLGLVCVVRVCSPLPEPADDARGYRFLSRFSFFVGVSRKEENKIVNDRWPLWLLQNCWILSEHNAIEHSKRGESKRKKERERERFRYYLRLMFIVSNLLSTLVNRFHISSR